jgi:hypothetical protein
MSVMDTSPLTIDIARFRKVWALTASTIEGEASAARAAADRMLRGAGLTWADGARLAGQAHGNSRPEPGPGFTFCDISTPQGQAAWAAYEARQRAERSQREAPERAELLRRYRGSIDAVFA